MIIRYIICFVLYVANGWAFGRIISDYAHELEMRLLDMRISGEKLYIRMSTHKWLNFVLLIIGGIFWPISDIAIVLRMEWNYSKLTQPD